tara:strand:- start:374 stop:571 length:198 start_codon:yes stop_codon:yes gene_type:complete
VVLKTYTVKEYKMIILDVANWIVEFLLFGIALFIWTLALCIGAMFISILNKFLKELLIKKENNNE